MILFDCFSPLSQIQIGKLTQANYQGKKFSGAIRYHDNLSQIELDLLHGAGLVVGLVGEAYSDAMAAPGAGFGERDGLRALSNLKRFSVAPPHGTTLWLDVEGTDKSPGEAVIAYVNAWAKIIQDAGYEAGLYYGWGINLSPGQAYHDLAVTRYWAASPHTYPPDTRGVCLTQLEENIVVNGVTVDVDETKPDLLGGEAVFF